MIPELWDETFKGRSWGQWPSEAVVRAFPQANRSPKVLDLGCGPGANARFLSRQGYAVWGIDGSLTAINGCWKDPEQSGMFLLGDITEELPFLSARFDAVLDSASLCCNNLFDIGPALAEVHRVLKPGGRFVSIGFTPKTTRDLTGQVLTYLSKQDVPGVYGLFEGLEMETYTRVDPKGIVTENLIVTCHKSSAC